MKQIASLTKQWFEDGLCLPIWMEGSRVCFIDQLALPAKEEVLSTDRVEDLASAIRTMTIRGSGAIGITGVYAMLLAAVVSKGELGAVLDAGELMKKTRPTAINLHKTVDELADFARSCSPADFMEGFEDKCCEILVRQLDFERRLGENGAALINDGDTVLTHCHSGALAGSGFGGRALSVIRTAFNQGKHIHVFTSETRPYLQGARITAYELSKFGIPHTLITDGMSGYLMRLGKIQKVVVGSDRVTANGDLINKVGTYMHALAAHENGVPFYTATSSHTIDFSLREGMSLKVEYRDENEVLNIGGKRITDAQTHALYPAFDVTPHEIISGIITEKGVITAPFNINLNKLKD